MVEVHLARDAAQAEKDQSEDTAPPFAAMGKGLGCQKNDESGAELPVQRPARVGLGAAYPLAYRKLLLLLLW